MLPIPAAAGSLFPVQSQLAAVTLPKYRELLRKLKANSSVEESSSAFQQAKERVLLRLQQRRWGLGPRRGSGTCGDVRCRGWRSSSAGGSPTRLPRHLTLQAWTDCLQASGSWAACVCAGPGVLRVPPYHARVAPILLTSAAAAAAPGRWRCRERARLDPNRAFRRLRDRMLQVRQRLTGPQSLGTVPGGRWVGSSPSRGFYLFI